MFSAGGRLAKNNANGFPNANPASIKPSASSGISPATHQGRPARRVDNFLSNIVIVSSPGFSFGEIIGCLHPVTSPGDFEETHPAQLGQLALMGVEHIQPWLKSLERKLQDAPLRLAKHNRIYDLMSRLERRAMIVIIEEVGVKVD